MTVEIYLNLTLAIGFGGLVWLFKPLRTLVLHVRMCSHKCGGKAQVLW